MNILAIILLTIVFLGLAVILVLSIGYLPMTPFTVKETLKNQSFMSNLPKPVAMEIQVNITGLKENTSITLHYSPPLFKQVRYNWRDYKNRFKNSVEKFFNKTKLSDIKTTYDFKEDEVIVLFNVSNHVWHNDERYTADFLWLLTPLNLDFIENGFKEYNDMLSWSGMINSVSVNITVFLPPQNTTYKAWGSNIGHCHGHVWWPSK